MTEILAIGAANGLLLALVLAVARGNRVANRTLALLLALLSLRACIYILGYAGAYDANRWLTFFPFDLSLAYGPLLWVHVRLLTTRSWPERWGWHFAPALAQLCYWLVCFAFPLQLKWDWYTGGHLQVVAPLGAAIALFSCGFYLHRSYHETSRYRAWLDGAYANRDEARLGELRLVLAAFASALAVAACFALYSWFVTPLDYFARFPLMVVFALLTYALGLLGWRNANRDYPLLKTLEQLAPAIDPALDSADEEIQTKERRRAQAEGYRARLEASNWWRDENFDLSAFALNLGISTRTLSRALSEGLGYNFRELVGRIRVDAVAAQLEQGGGQEGLLDLALACGFASKASFNRAFVAYRGITPSEFRASCASPAAQKPPKRNEGCP